MAEKSGDINNADNLDPIAVNAGAGSDPFLEKYADDYETSSTESREMMDNTGEHPEETEHLRAQIEETRQQMGETIDRIQERLSFSNVSEQVSEHVSNAIETAKDSIYEATIGKAVTFMRNTGDGIARSNVMRTVRDNPFPLILIGLGAGLLAYQSYSKGNRRGSYRSSNRYFGSGGYGTNWERRDNPGQSSLRETGRSGEGYAGETYNKVTDAAGSAYNSVSNAAGTALDSVSSAATNALQGVTETARNAYSGAGDLVSRAYDTAGDYGSRAYDTYDYYVEENPLAVAAVAAALGAAVGFAIPSSDFEDRLMGESKQNLMQQAQNSAGDLIKRAKQVADEAGHTLKDEANRALNQ